MIGAIIGDIAGSLFEFHNTSDYNFRLFQHGCSYTDDTICTVAVADAALRGDTSVEGYKQSLLRWCKRYPHPMGSYGGMFDRWIFSPGGHKPYGSFGNGAAMRVSPVGWAFDTEADVIRQAFITAEVTHNHREGLIGAAAVALAIFRLRIRYGQGGQTRVIESIMKTCYGPKWRDNLPPQGQFEDTCQGTVPVAFDIISRSEGFEDAIRKAVSYGGDSDTLAAITGSLAEAIWPIPDDMSATALGFLPDRMRSVVNDFYARFIPPRQA